MHEDIQRRYQTAMTGLCSLLRMSSGGPAWLPRLIGSSTSPLGTSLSAQAPASFSSVSIQDIMASAALPTPTAPVLPRVMTAPSVAAVNGIPAGLCGVIPVPEAVPVLPGSCPPLNVSKGLHATGSAAVSSVSAPAVQLQEPVPGAYGAPAGYVSQPLWATTSFGPVQSHALAPAPLFTPQPALPGMATAADGGFTSSLVPPVPQQAPAVAVQPPVAIAAQLHTAALESTGSGSGRQGRPGSQTGVAAMDTFRESKQAACTRPGSLDIHREAVCHAEGNANVQLAWPLTTGCTHGHPFPAGTGACTKRPIWGCGSPCSHSHGSHAGRQAAFQGRHSFFEQQGLVCAISCVNGLPRLCCAKGELPLVFKTGR